MYGDTDSMFVLLPVSPVTCLCPSFNILLLCLQSCSGIWQHQEGCTMRDPACFHFIPCKQGRTREEAFRIGAEIASAVTAANPPPVTLKMEKVR